MSPSTPKPASPLEVFRAFFRLGLTSFGGPVAHLGFFRTEFVERRRWIDDRAWADLVALCQFLPGPASSQAGFALGLHRAGWRGGVAAWAGFTLPSALLMVLAAWALLAGVGVGTGAGAAPSPLVAAVLQGVKAAVVAVVVQALLGMARSLCPDRRHALIGFAAAITALLLPDGGAWLAMGLGAVAGWLASSARSGAPSPPGAAAAPAGRLAASASPGDSSARRGSAVTDDAWRPSPRAAALLGVVWALGLLLAAGPDLMLWLGLTFSLSPLGPSAASGLVGSPGVAPVGVAGPWEAAATMWRAGALVFGGGHVVLPLLEPGIVGAGLLPADTFLAGYAAAQAIPGPMFTLAAFLGAAMAPGVQGLGLAAACVVAIFLPGLLLVAAAWPWWQRLSANPHARRILAGLQAAVVGVLGAACYDPVFTAGVRGPVDGAVAVGAFALLTAGRLSPPWVMGLAGLAGAAQAVI
jgi:chromate transporter